ncbi:polycomb protein Sfmbt isoform X2 [Diabrotica virgifera virgifera]|uniref:Polycomb protein Sfmbt isoform X2 n=1 Tax=Diabrotica virgifera virgifera TaxID=50390 RepID=A0A6P7FKP2_DIAVI|nr:polycomb protein Sfmbt isoform X2 [Diabrotica virgifera virgifera]XP_028133728.1 polycomb protein Sfmbt isoform X2 [Diabrotica virgifera virgifera]
MYSTMPGVAEMGMVWMGSGQTAGDMSMGELMPNDNSDILLDHDNIYYTPSNHSMSNQSMDDIHTGHSSHMDTMENYDMMHYLDIKNESNDSSYMDDDSPNPVYMITTSTQTLPSQKKIKPIKHPGLVLKTPIAYHSNTDPSVIPIQKDGIAVCEKCGAIGVKHAFYTRERRFCSMACARGYSGLIPEPLPQQYPSTPDSKHHFAKYRFSMKLEDDFADSYIDDTIPQLSPLPELPPIDDSLPLIRRKPAELANSFDWDSMFSEPYFVAAPVTCFKHAPMADIWDNIMVGMKVEIENTDCDNVSEAFADSFWVATVVRIVGYKAQLRYEGFGENDSKDFWVSLCSNQVHPVGWCATRGKPLIPPKTIENKYSDWKDFLRKRLTGARTLPSNFSNKASDSLKSRFECGLNLEVVDKDRISQVKLAIVHKIVGKRLNVKYYDMPPEDDGFWCHEDSPLLHPVGWAKKVNHHLVAPINYLERVNDGIFDDDDATEDLFNPYQVGFMENSVSGFCIGMKLEAIDPLNLSSISVATVTDVLNYGYIMIRIDTYDSDVTGADWFCYHVKSPCIFPVGFCEKHNIPLTPPKGYDVLTFNWKSYLLQTGSSPALPSLFKTFIPLHGFQPGMKIEAADLMAPRLLCIATIAKVTGRLLKVHFDGWEDEYDQWLDCESPDIYPVGWCQSVGYKLEGPPAFAKQLLPVVKTQKAKKRGRKKKKDTASKSQQHAATSTNSETSSVFEAPEPLERMEQSETSEVGGIEEPEEMPTETDLATIIPDIESLASTEDINDSHGPEAGQEPAGPDQSLPISSEVVDDSFNPCVNSSTPSSPKVIPRLIDNSGSTSERSELCPKEWSSSDIVQFLRVNDCANYSDAFSKQNIDGKKLLDLSKEDVIDITGGKVGPSLKIYDLVQQLKLKMNLSQVRHSKANIKKFL